MDTGTTDSTGLPVREGRSDPEGGHSICGRGYDYMGMSPHWPFTGEVLPERKALELSWDESGQVGGLSLDNPLDLTGNTLRLRAIVDPAHDTVRFRVRLTDSSGASVDLDPGESSWLPLMSDDGPTLGPDGRGGPPEQRLTSLLCRRSSCLESPRTSLDSGRRRRSPLFRVTGQEGSAGCWVHEGGGGDDQPADRTGAVHRFWWDADQGRVRGERLLVQLRPRQIWRINLAPGRPRVHPGDVTGNTGPAWGRCWIRPQRGAARVMTDSGRREGGRRPPPTISGGSRRGPSRRVAGHPGDHPRQTPDQ